MSVESALTQAFAERLGSLRTITHESTPWFSATFSGARHVFRIEVDDMSGLASFESELGEAEIQLPRGFVADVAVTRPPIGASRNITVEVLTIDD